MEKKGWKNEWQWITNNTIHNTLLIFKKGNFYNIYNDNAIIFSFLFGYKISIEGKAGFPETAYTKVTNTLDDKKIDYQIIYKEKEPVIKKFGKLNKYEKVLKNALEYRSIFERVERIKEKINNINNIELLDKIIKVIENELQWW